VSQYPNKLYEENKINLHQTGFCNINPD